MNSFLKLYKNLHNIIEFNIRKNIKLSRGEYSYNNELKKGLFLKYDNKRELLIKKEKIFREKYKLQEFYENSTIKNYKYNLFILELLNKYIELPDNDNISILDIGSKNWEYVFGEYYFFKNGNDKKNIYLYGIELDAYRRYRNFWTRYDYAQAYIKKLENCKYIVGDFLKHIGNYDYILWFFPFVIPSPLINWGLPFSYFKPDSMLKHSYDLLKKNGSLLIVNQFLEEYELQSKILKKLNINFEKRGNFIGEFLDENRDFFITIIKKTE